MHRGPPASTVSRLPVVLEPQPVDQARLARLHVAARAIVERPERHTPLELQWAKEVVDLTVALQEARNQVAQLAHGGDGAC